jgi:transcriptional regulator with XRE-family HTH domain
MLGNAPIAPNVALGRALRWLRLVAGLSQETLGLESGVLRNFIALIGRGQNQPIITTIFKLAGALGMKASDLVAAAGLEPSPKPHVRRAATQ